MNEGLRTLFLSITDLVWIFASFQVMVSKEITPLLGDLR